MPLRDNGKIHSRLVANPMYVTYISIRISSRTHSVTFGIIGKTKFIEQQGNKASGNEKEGDSADLYAVRWLIARRIAYRLRFGVNERAL